MLCVSNRCNRHGKIKLAIYYRVLLQQSNQCSLPPERKHSVFESEVREMAKSDAPLQDASDADAPFHVNDVSTMLKSLPSTSAGWDALHPLLLRHLPPAAMDYVTIVYNFSYKHSVVPAAWK